MSISHEKLPVVLLTGFLGSGKTLLLNALLRAPAFANTAVIVNEFGEIGLDHALVQSSTDNVVLLEAGCLCCTIAETLLGHGLVTDHYRLEAVVTTVDAVNAGQDLEHHREVAKQIAVADRLVITKADVASSAQRQALRQRLSPLNPHAGQYESSRGSAAIAAFAPCDGPRSRAVPASQPPHAHAPDVNRHDARIRAHCFVLDGPVSWSGVVAWSRLVAEELGDRLLRCKAVLEIADTAEVVFLQGVQRVFHKPERLPGWPDGDHRSRLVCITRDVGEEELRRTLEALKLPPGSDPHVMLANLSE